jgi:putative glutamine amidotransferase
MPARSKYYEEWVVRAGGIAVFVRPSGMVRDICAAHDGFLIPGGRDLDPSRYGESPLPETVLEEPERTGFEFSLLHEIISERKPVLGICYGMQLINVFWGGSLFQDIRLGTPGLIDHRKGGHIITIKDNPYIPMEEREVNSSHHQAVRRMGAGLQPWAYAADGIIEGLYGEQEGFIVGVQWHPERMKSVLTTDLFRRFIDACRKR